LVVFFWPSAGQDGGTPKKKKNEGLVYRRAPNNTVATSFTEGEGRNLLRRGLRRDRRGREKDRAGGGPATREKRIGGPQGLWTSARRKGSIIRIGIRKPDGSGAFLEGSLVGRADATGADLGGGWAATARARGWIAKDEVRWQAARSVRAGRRMSRRESVVDCARSSRTRFRDSGSHGLEVRAGCR